MLHTNARNKNTNMQSLIVFIDGDVARGYPVNLQTAATIYDNMYRPVSNAHLPKAHGGVLIAICVPGESGANKVAVVDAMNCPIFSNTLSSEFNRKNPTALVDARFAIK